MSRFNQAQERATAALMDALRQWVGVKDCELGEILVAGTPCPEFHWAFNLNEISVTISRTGSYVFQAIFVNEIDSQEEYEEIDQIRTALTQHGAIDPTLALSDHQRSQALHARRYMAVQGAPEPLRTWVHELFDALITFHMPIEPAIRISDFIELHMRRGTDYYLLGIVKNDKYILEYENAHGEITGWQESDPKKMLERLLALDLIVPL
ncbi:hypothetical protein N7326_08400 [Corynebacterium sp. ES2794-CONJ1]|uniref:hypothetical protein n=1 Tax=unclassified Corynebacterium TaxID=2624378 RepID=UPI002169366A|nr:MULTISPECIES: hypothetical protein [unclassified Corynebacterium]MCS4490542.1 hypothetical protein [Corynebacterium sp. ES2775-CONJ]MCS4492321.1 hypothetical protein [Corynebacterium sp. ES2715-CONJ3]MCS4532487.1 hypothetical protein [Corynebacterium sp. ES2730-CONJ]MCU9519882.1 hypothetical protein [Corynebacterium sp. ES2794-CONJ1]